MFIYFVGSTVVSDQFKQGLTMYGNNFKQKCENLLNEMWDIRKNDSLSFMNAEIITSLSDERQDNTFSWLYFKF